ncbi:MAG: hypothetical protein IKO57_02120 [Treponema sp.]|nr:hypothetical protein [Treponema sp.]
MNRGWAYGKLGNMEKCRQDIDYAVRTMIEMQKNELAEEQYRCAKAEFPSIDFEKPLKPAFFTTNSQTAAN